MIHSAHTQHTNPAASEESAQFRFCEEEVIHRLKHYLPAQAPLKDFIHHNTLHAFQDLDFHYALRKSSVIFGYKVSLTLHEYREAWKSGRIRPDILSRVLRERKGDDPPELWMHRLISKEYSSLRVPRVGQLRRKWRKYCDTDMDAAVHPVLFRLLCGFLDQGMAIWNFPVQHLGFLDAVREMEKNSFISIFRTRRVKQMLLSSDISIPSLLQILVGTDTSLYETYLFDQQFSHQGWSGMVSVLEDDPSLLTQFRHISLKELIQLELLLEIDALDARKGGSWKPLEQYVRFQPLPLFADTPPTEWSDVFMIWQEAYEWSYYDEVLRGISVRKPEEPEARPSFQVMLCIDDRECSFRRYLESTDPSCRTYGTPGFFGVEFFFKPQGGKFHTKLCPAPVTPKHLIREISSVPRHKRDVHITRHTHGIASGALISQTLGVWAALKLFVNLFKPSFSPATASSFQHMDQYSQLTVENQGPQDREDGLQVGFTTAEMAVRVETLLRSIGLVKNFSSLIYVVGHGSSSTNNPHYAAYDCGACSGRPGSVNARVFSYMANHAGVRKILAEKGIVLPAECRFVGGLHDTSRDEVIFFDEDALPALHREVHARNLNVFEKALSLNAQERSRRLELVDTSQRSEEVHEKMKLRSVSLFEPRPELNHATNALCIVGRRSVTHHLFLDRRAFLNSYDCKTDPSGDLLLNILKAAAPVCGGINLEYFFSRMDNQKLGAGTKLPHNVMGLIGVANGYDGDLRPGLPSQMIEVHDPVRLMIIAEQEPDVILHALSQSPPTFDWFRKHWIHLVAIHPDTSEIFLFDGEAFRKYEPLTAHIPVMDRLHDEMMKTAGNMQISLLQNDK